MINMLAVFLAVAAGAALVAQGELLAAISRHHGLWTALLTNSLVGTTLLIIICWATGNFQIKAVWLEHQWRSIIPGLLGTAFVFASVNAYSQLGAFSAAAFLVTAQLTAASLADFAGLSAAGHSMTVTRIVGIALLLAGSVLALPRT